MIDIVLENNQVLDIDVQTIASEPIDLGIGTIMNEGGQTTSKVIVNPMNDPTDSMETIKVDGITYDILEKDPTVPEWAKEPIKPSYTAEEVGAVDVNDELSTEEIDEIFHAVFGI